MGAVSSRILFAAVLGLLAHAFIGYEAFPFGDDWAYAPLAEHRADPSLYPRDDQLKLFESHAKVYEWVYWLGKDGPGVEPLFRLSLWILAAGVGVALWACLAGLGAPLAALPAVMGLGVVVQLHGLGRGDFGGLISPFFHHHNVALTLVLAALAATLFKRVWWAGILLGLAAYCQPMTALHGALIVGFGTFYRAPLDAGRLALAAVIVAIPAAISLLHAIGTGSQETAVNIDLIKDAYRFRAPHHYDPKWRDMVLTSMYLIAGILGAIQLHRISTGSGRVAVGVMAGFLLLHMVTLLVYKEGFGTWIGFFILDANRSSAMLFALGPAVAMAALWRQPREPLTLAAVAALAVAFGMNFTFAGACFVLCGLGMVLLRHRSFYEPVALIVSLAALLLFFPPPPYPSQVSKPTRDALEAIRQETPADALFVIPIGLSAFRHYAQRSAYVDFKLFSVAQPEQAALTRERIELVAPPAPGHENAQGWYAANRWDEDQRLRATCDAMANVLTQTGATYYLRPLAANEEPPDCPRLALGVATATLALYGPLE